MFEKISKLMKFGIFRDFSWGDDTPNLARFNLIYGWNKSGKTTLSKVFVACEKKTTEFEQYPGDGKQHPGNGEFEVRVSGGSEIRNSDCQNVTRQVRVFNRDFVEGNVSFDPTTFSNPIVYVSEKEIKDKERLDELRQRNDNLYREFESAKDRSKKYKDKEDSFRKSTALLIKKMLGNLKVQDQFTYYDKGDVKSKIDAVELNNFSKLPNEEFEKNRKKLTATDSPATQEPLPSECPAFSYEGKELLDFPEIHNQLSKLLNRQVVAETIERFENDPELNKWAEQGFNLHRNRDEKSKCMFCQNELSANFWELLSKHFSNDYEKLQNDIKSFMKLPTLKREEISVENSSFHSDLQDKYKHEAEKLNAIVRGLNDWIDKAVEKLEMKREKPLSRINVMPDPEDFWDMYSDAIEKLNSIVNEHNSKVKNHEAETMEAKKELEKHLIAEAIEEQNYIKTVAEYESSVEAERKLKESFEKNRKEISGLEEKTSDIGRAVQEINCHLEGFFGRKEIQLELDGSNKGYVIKRDSGIAYNLSEGEKNAIAFAYFIAKMQETGFEMEKGIVVIDDPVSSFDSNFVYHCFSLVKNHFRSAGQLIVLTHNFEFFNLIKQWFQKKNQKKNKESIPCEFFMIKNGIKNEERYASVVPLDKTLQKFKSEYNFLFSMLCRFRDEGKEDYADLYTIGNVARRFLEIFVNFKIQTTGDLKSKMDQLDGDNVTQTEKDKVYRLIQEFSHGGDPVSMIEHKDKSEIRNAIEVLMKIVEESDKKHFNSLKESVTAVC